MSLWATLPEGVSATAFARHAGRDGALIASRQQSSAIDGDQPNIRIPFTSPLHDLTEDMRRVTEAWQTFDRQSTRPSAI